MKMYYGLFGGLIYVGFLSLFLSLFGGGEMGGNCGGEGCNENWCLL